MEDLKNDVVRNYALTVHEENNQLKEKIKTLNNNIEMLQNEIDFYKQSLQLKDEEVKKLNEKLDEIITEYNTKFNEMNSILSVCKKEYEDFMISKAKNNRTLNDLNHALNRQLAKIKKNDKE